MQPDPLSSLVYRILIAAVDLGWEPPGWRALGEPRPWVAARPDPRARIEQIARAITSQLTL